jgi:hypothetical protein
MHATFLAISNGGELEIPSCIRAEKEDTSETIPVDISSQHHGKMLEYRP